MAREEVEVVVFGRGGAGLLCAGFGVGVGFWVEEIRGGGGVWGWGGAERGGAGVWMLV